MTDTLPAPVRQFVLACILLEVVALGGRLVGFGEGIRHAMIALGGFWPGLLEQVSPAYPGQAVAMFATSAVLHGNPIHLAMNMVGLIWLGPMVVDRVGVRGFWPLAGLCAIGAGLVHVLMVASHAPMVGASGVLFGLLGAVAAWVVLERRARGQSLRPYLGHALALLGINVLLTLTAPDTIAWAAHLGGFLAGAGCALLTWDRLGHAA